MIVQHEEPCPGAGYKELVVSFEPGKQYDGFKLVMPDGSRFHIRMADTGNGINLNYAHGRGSDRIAFLPNATNTGDIIHYAEKQQ